jgi:uncharacterized protein YbbK (DUF523 family)
MDRPWVGVSPCLLGVAVRYDGEERGQSAVLDLGGRVRWVPVCPEAGAGLGTPREPARLVAAPESLRFVTQQTGRDQTETLARFIAETLGSLPWNRLAGWVLKARSPSCGWGTTPWFSDGDPAEPAGMGHGLWAEALHRVQPELPLIDEDGLREPRQRRRWLARVEHRDRALRSAGAHPGSG